MSKYSNIPNITSQFASQQSSVFETEHSYLVSGIATVSFTVEIVANSAQDAEAIFNDDALHLIKYQSDNQLHDINVHQVL